MAEPKTQPKSSRPDKPGPKPDKKKPAMPEVLADTAPEEREEVILRLIKGLKKA